MEAVKFKGQNCTFTAPDCFDLPTLVEKQETGHMTVTSCWKPSEEELAILNAGGCVCLCVRGGQPPVALWAEAVSIEE